MASNIALLYGGTGAEASAVEFVGWLAAGLDANAECLFAKDSLAMLTPAQRQNYRALLELGGWNEARDFLLQSADAQFGRDYQAAQLVFKEIRTHRPIDWSTPLELNAESDSEYAELAYCHDYVVASHALLPGVVNAMMQQVLVHAGAPVCAIAHKPYAAALSDATIVVAWKSVAPTRRALHAALPLLRRAANIHLVAIEGPTNPALTPSAYTVGGYLRTAHGLNATVTVLHEADKPEAQLADFYREQRADVLVMGAYSHSRLQTILFGSFVKFFMARKECNLFLAH